MRKDGQKTGFIEAMVITITVSGILLFVVWQLAAARVAPRAEELQEQLNFLSSDLAALNSRLKNAQARQVVLEKETAVLRQANRLLRQYESERQSELGRLNAELDFYGRLAGTSGGLSGLDLYRVELVPTESDRVFQFILTLTQNIRQASIISGKTRLDLEGTLENRPVTLHWSQINEGDAPEPEFRFKYFQQVEGYLTLPEGFSPTRLLVTLEAQDRKTPVVRRYTWAELRSN